MRQALNVFVDPVSQKSLNLNTGEIRGGHVISGSLSSGIRKYPIIRGIPRFVAESFYTRECNSKEGLTTNSFGYKWNDVRHKKLGSTKEDLKNLKTQFLALLGCQNISELKIVLRNARNTLNAGCGVAWSEYIFNYYGNVKRHCIDLSLSVETAYEKTKDISNVIVSQASIFQLPYRDEYFDIIYCLGVLHHTPDPKKAFMRLVKKLADGGLFGIYIYNKKPFLREIADAQIRKITTKITYDECMKFSHGMSQLGQAFSKLRGDLDIKEDIELLGIKKGKYNPQRFIYDYFLKCWFNPKQDLRYADLVNQDWYHPYYASHHTEKEVVEWFKQCGLKNIKVLQPKGWEYSGYFISGRKK